MNTRLKLLALLSLAAFAIAGCNGDPEDPEPFSVAFRLASVPEGLTLDSLDIAIAIGENGPEQALTIDLKSGTSRGQVPAFPGQRYVLTYTLFASGFDIGEGEESGTLAKDMKILLNPVWDYSKVSSARAAREQGKLLPAYLEASFGLALAGKPLVIVIDSAEGHEYSWHVRAEDGTLASGTGARMEFTPADSLSGRTLNVKLVVKQGTKVIEERDWDVKVLGSLPADRLIGIVTKTDTSAEAGSYTHFAYDAEGRPEYILFFDTTAFDSGREPVGTLAYAYTSASRGPSKVVRTARGDGDIDSAFSYDSQGRLVSVTVTLKSGTTSDSIAYVSDKVTETRSFAQGGLMRRIVHVTESATAEVDSVFSRAGATMTLTGLIRYELGDGKIIRKRIFRKLEKLEAAESEWTLYNALGSIAFRNRYTEGSALILEESETYAYKPDGLLDRILLKDEASQEVLRAVYHVHEAAPMLAKSAANPAAKNAARCAAGQAPAHRTHSARLARLAAVNAYFPLTRLR